MSVLLENQCKWLNQTEGKLHTLDGYYCEKCRGKGHFYKVRGDEVVGVKCSCLAVRRTLRIIHSSGLESMLKTKTFDSFKATEKWQAALKDKARLFVNNEEKRMFFIGGQCGAGKTHLCTAICSELIKQSKPTLYFLWTRDARALKAAANDVAFADIIAPYKETEVLYIDDFFKVMQGASPTPADVNIAFEILNSRLIDPTKITIISSEFSISELLELDEGIASRICECGGDFIVSISKSHEKNYRLKCFP